MAEFRIYKDEKDEYRWQFFIDNQSALAVSSEGYKNKSECEENIKIFKRIAPETPIYEQSS